MARDLMELRVKNLRELTLQWGGPSSIAKKLKISGPSYISQLISGHRPLTEKSVRRFEKELGLPVGWFDKDHDNPTPATPLDDSLVTRVIVLVATVANEQGVAIRPEQLAEVVSLVYGEAQRSGRLDEQLVNRIVSLLK